MSISKLEGEPETRLCPECYALVVCRYVPPSIARIGWGGAFQVRFGPEHERVCAYWREKTPDDF